MSLIALVDADIIVHRVGYTTNDETVDIAKYRLDTTVDTILQAFRFTDAEFYLSDSLENNYRLKIAPDYKANRKDQPKPVHYNALKEHFIVAWKAKISLEMEADDELGIRQTELGDGSIICSIDKDLLQIPGKHFNFVRNTLEEVTEDMGRHYFYTSILTGDVTDNIKGIHGIGPKKAAKILDRRPGNVDAAYCEVILDAYLANAVPFPIDAMDKAGKLLHIKRTRTEGSEWSLWNHLGPITESM